LTLRRRISAGCSVSLRKLYAIFYLEIYRSRPHLILYFMFWSLLMWTVLALLFGTPRRTRRGWMWFNRIVAGCSLLGILGITVFYRFIGGGGDVGINLIPFRVPEEAWRAEEYYRMLLMNTFLFFPLGLTLGYAWRPERNFGVRFGLTVLSGFALSLFCETVQGLFAIGTAETDDLLMNTAGALLGACSVLVAGGLIHLFDRIRNRRQTGNDGRRRRHSCGAAGPENDTMIDTEIRKESKQ
jgi:glycopeptide antibiotics resistance protein